MFLWSLSSAELPPAVLGRLVRIETKLDRILDHLGIDREDLAESSGLSTEVREIARSGRKIEAIKVYRQQTGAGLKESKDAVEAYLMTL